MKKLKYYFETTIFNFVFADDAPDKKEVTKKLFNTWADLNGEMYISEIVIDEIERCGEPKRSKMYNLTQKFNPTILELTEEVRELAQKYIAEGIIPERY